MAGEQEKEREAHGVEDTGEIETPKVSAVADTTDVSPPPDEDEGKAETETPQAADS